MTATAYVRGHLVEFVGETWRYRDTGVALADEPERPCVRCGALAAPGAPDPCLGTLPGISSACCGHGVTPPFAIPERSAEGGRRD